ncbi:MAG: phage integrase SAM-like domain-containing protein, partial [Bacteroidota bacterium]
FLKLYISEIQLGRHDINKNTMRNYQSVLTRLLEFRDFNNQGDIKFEDISLDWYTEYFIWSKENELGITSFDKVIKIIKKIMRIALERELHHNTIYQHPEFKRQRKPKGDKVYLTIKEIEKVENLDLSTMAHLERERDRFLISYYFMMRWGDSTSITESAIIEHCGLNYSYVANKTGIQCIVPISTKAKDLIERRGYNFDADSNQKANQKIKEICMLAGITQMAQQSGVKAPKYKFVTTHTARRSAATNLYLEGMDLETIARIGGWKKLETLKLYLRASGMEVAQNAKKFDFFK